MAVHNEVVLETEISEHLAAHDWLYSPNDDGYDVKRALFPEDLFGWIAATQPEVWAKAVPAEALQTISSAAKQQLLDRLVKVLDAPLDAGGGTLSVLRRGFKDGPNSFRMAQFKPADELNPKTNADYAAMRVRVVRQVHYSKQNKNSIDLVLFVNGLPVATLELKTDFTQSIEDAVQQYREDRLPKGEPLLSFGHRALVHFAVSNTEVRMTTKLAGEQTVFLPFNRGNGGRAGNPVNPDGSATAYLWEWVLERDAWLDILGRFLHLQVTKWVDPVTGMKRQSETLLFPRFHQWESVTQLLAAARNEGPGHRYLVQHSAGSGKTNSIAWTAHQLSTLHRGEGGKVFDSVIVITDRTVLDDQLREAIRQIDSKAGVVVAIDDKGEGSKSSRLADALASGAQIIVVTIQTFPFVLKELAENVALHERTFAVVADEAHSSQTGTTANKVKSVLSGQELAELEDGGEVSVDDLLAAEMAARADPTNLSFFAYTATPKAKTLELFGRKGPDGKPVPFHVYTMQQAIEEGFILDVLRTYTPVKRAFKLSYQGVDVTDEDAQVDKSHAVKALVQWVNAETIPAKVKIIAEHFDKAVSWRLAGKAKAMVVTGSRLDAVRYKLAFDSWLKQHKSELLRPLGTLVAFSGEVGHPDFGDESYTEASQKLNPALKGRSIPEALASDQFQVLIVANKYQTGFDQPLLSAMYVDKKLSGVNAVQTLSRLNRTATGKDWTAVVDFVNDPAVIVESFEPYYRDAKLSDVSDPNVVHDIRSKLDMVGIYEPSEVENAARAVVLGELKGKPTTGNSALSSAVEPGRQRFHVRFDKALGQSDQEERDRLELFRTDLRSYVKAYDFLSQIVDYADVEVEKFAIYARALSAVLKRPASEAAVDLSGVELLKYAISPQDARTLALEGGIELDPPKQGGGAVQDPVMTSLLDAVEALNQLWDGDFTEADAMGVVTWVSGKAGEDAKLASQAQANSEQQFLASPDLKPKVVDALLDSQSNLAGIGQELFGSEQKLAKFIELIGKVIWDQNNRAA